MGSSCESKIPKSVFEKLCICQKIRQNCRSSLSLEKLCNCQKKDDLWTLYGDLLSARDKTSAVWQVFSISRPGATRGFWWRNGRHKYVKKIQPRYQQVINETHSTNHVPPLGHDLPTVRNQVQLCTNFNSPISSVSKPADAMHLKCVHELTQRGSQHQLVREMRGGKAVRVQLLHRAGAHDQQHRCVRADVHDLQLLHGRLHHRHGSCAVC